MNARRRAVYSVVALSLAIGLPGCQGGVSSTSASSPTASPLETSASPSPSPSPSVMTAWPEHSTSPAISDDTAILTVVKVMPELESAAIGDVIAARDLHCSLWRKGEASYQQNPSPDFTPAAVYEAINEATMTGAPGHTTHEAAIFNATMVMWGCPEYQAAVERGSGFTFNRP